MEVAVDAITSATKVALLGERRVRKDGSIIRAGRLDSEIFLAEQESIFKLHRRGPDGQVFALATQLYSDAAVVSWSGGMCHGGKTS